MKPKVFRSCFKSFWIWKGDYRKNAAFGDSKNLSFVAYKLCCDFKQVFEPQTNCGTEDYMKSNENMCRNFKSYKPLRNFQLI